MAFEHIIDSNLLECPFCGATPELIKNDYGLSARYYVECPHCGIQQGYSYDYEDAVEKWNERTR